MEEYGKTIKQSGLLHPNRLIGMPLALSLCWKAYKLLLLLTGSWEWPVVKMQRNHQSAHRVVP